MQFSEATKHPIDFETLQKGSTISREEIERAFKVRLSENPNGYRLMMLKLSQQIEDERPDLLTRFDGDNIRIMMDLEADEVTYRRGEKAVRSLGKNARRRAVIDRTEFNVGQLRVAETRDKHMTALALLTRKELDKAQRSQRLLQDREAKEELSEEDEDEDQDT